MDVVVVGGGQAGLATGFYLRRAGPGARARLRHPRRRRRPGGAWPRMWDGLRLFSPATYSSLPGWMMPPGTTPPWVPAADHVVDYLTRYEERYDLHVLRPHRVTAVWRADGDPTGRLAVAADGLTLAARGVVSATGTWDRPFWPSYPGMGDFAGRQLHAVDYRTPGGFAGQRVVVVGGGNSAAQILAEVSTVAETTWVTTATAAVPRPTTSTAGSCSPPRGPASRRSRRVVTTPGAGSATSSWSPASGTPGSAGL